MKSLIELDNVWKTYRMGEMEVSAIQGVSLSINMGDFVAITGPSGSGKSTMMNVVGALDMPTKGSVYLDGKDVSKMRESDLSSLRGKKIGFVFQQFNLIQTLTALENVMMPMELQGVDGKISEMKARKLLEQVGLSDRMHHTPSQLSGGQQQRVAIARALAADPEIILADEPTGNLDSKSGEYIMDILGKLHKDHEKTIILVTHDINLVHYAHRIVKLKDGKVESDNKNISVRGYE